MSMPGGGGGGIPRFWTPTTHQLTVGRRPSGGGGGLQILFNFLLLNGSPTNGRGSRFYHGYPRLAVAWGLKAEVGGVLWEAFFFERCLRPRLHCTRGSLEWVVLGGAMGGGGSGGFCPRWGGGGGSRRFGWGGGSKWGDLGGICRQSQALVHHRLPLPPLALPLSMPSP